MAKIRFGPSGLGGVNEAEINLKNLHNLRLKACEVAFTRSIYLKKEDASKIGKTAKELNIFLSIHAPYFVNLNSDEKKKVEATKARILKCCEIGHYLSAGGDKCRIIFHPGYYGKGNRELAYDNIKKGIIEMIEKIKENNWNVEICAETMGKVNVFGSIDEVSRLAKETGCGFCIDFAHIMARNNGERKFEEIKKAFPQKKWHCHFSGIVYGDKGEKHHIPTLKEEWKKLLEFLKGLDKDIVIINESPKMIKDSLEGLNFWEKIK